MKYEIMLEILFDLLAKRKLTATYFASKYDISVRTVYRYVDVLSMCVPIQIQQGRGGGIYISDSYKLPMGFMTREEYDAAITALGIAYQQLPEERFEKARTKLSAQMKTEVRELTLSGTFGTVLVDGGTWGDTHNFSDKMRFFESAIKDCFVLDIEYNSRTGEHTKRKIEPHILVFKQGVWYVYAFCRKQRDFRLFRLGRIVSSVQTEEKFIRRPIKREDVPLNYWTDANSVDVVLEINEDGFADALDWLGAESLKDVGNGVWRAEVSLPYDEVLVKKIIGLGAGVQVIAPNDLRADVKKSVEKICALY